jgi:hypothetical protein
MKRCSTYFEEAFHHIAMEAISTKEEVYPLPEDEKLFAIGYYYGQCEKIFLGACKAAMFRPDERNWDTCLKAIYQICEKLELDITLVPMERGGQTEEIWVSQPGTVLDFRQVQEGCESWHIRRGVLCGISEDKIDPKWQE